MLLVAPEIDLGTTLPRGASSLDRPWHVNHNDHYVHYDCHAMISETSAVAFRQNLGEMLNQVQYRRDSIVINKDGKPVAALVDARLFERIRRMQGRFDDLCQRIEAGYADVPEAEGLAEIDAAVAAVRLPRAQR
jgi:prevent-host-death family protein